MAYSLYSTVGNESSASAMHYSNAFNTNGGSGSFPSDTVQRPTLADQIGQDSNFTNSRYSTATPQRFDISHTVSSMPSPRVTDAIYTAPRAKTCSTFQRLQSADGFSRPPDTVQQSGDRHYAVNSTPETCDRLLSSKSNNPTGHRRPAGRGRDAE